MTIRDGDLDFYDPENAWTWPFEPDDPTDQTLAQDRNGRWQQVPSGLRTSATRNDILKADVELDCIQKRIEGKSYARIALEMGWVSERTGRPIDRVAREMVLRGLRRWASEPQQELVALENARLDELTERIWPIIMQVGGKGTDDRALRAIDRYMQISTARRQINGLDAAIKVQAQINARVDHTVTGHVVVEKVEALTEYLGTIDEVMADELARAKALPAYTNEEEEAAEAARDNVIVEAEVVEGG